MTTPKILLLISIASAQGLSAQAASGPPVGLTNIVPARVYVSRPLLSRTSQVSSNNWGRGVIIGGVIGTAIGIFFYKSFEHETHGGIYVVGWAFAGAVVGGLIGSGSHRT